MKRIILIAFAMVLLAGGMCLGQDKKTIVLVRHAEKDASAGVDPQDPGLSAEGIAHANLLVKKLRKYKPHEIFATNYKRTKLTAEPMAKKRSKQVQVYDPAKQQDLAAQIMSGKTEHYMVVGHSNTIPILANLIAKREIFRPLVEAEHGIVYVIRMRKGVLKDIKVFSYL
jgi:2,3-bisphosphoglycerate-dependent phosphoglycerate mutase